MSNCRNDIVELLLPFDNVESVGDVRTHQGGSVHGKGHQGDNWSHEGMGVKMNTHADGIEQGIINEKPTQVSAKAKGCEKKRFRGRPMKRKKKAPVTGSPSYLSLLNPAKAEELGKEIFKIVVLEKGFLDPSLKASGLAKRLGTNTRYFSITMSRRFHCNFSSFLGRLRVEEAMTYMADSRYDEVSLQDMASLVGFSSRQSFISAFQKINGMTPSEYRASVRVG